MNNLEWARDIYREWEMIPPLPAKPNTGDAAMNAEKPVNENLSFARRWAAVQSPPVTLVWYTSPINTRLCYVKNSPQWFSCGGVYESEDEAWAAIAPGLATIRRSLEPVIAAGLRAEVEALRQGLKCGNAVREFGNFVNGMTVDELRAEVERLKADKDRLVEGAIKAAITVQRLEARIAELEVERSR